MSWSKTSESVWSRPIDPTERVLRNVGHLLKAVGREHWMVNTIFSLEKPTNGNAIPSEALLQAWTSLRYQAPLIAVLLDADNFTYETPSPEKLKEWQTSTFVVHEQSGVTAEEFTQQVEWSDESKLHWFPQTSQLLFRVHHWLVDGLGSIHMGRIFFKSLAAILENDNAVPAPVFGDEWQRLQLGLIEVSGLPTEASEAHQAEAMQIALNLLGSPTAGLPYSGPPQMPGSSKRARLSVSTSLDSILAKCKEHQIGLGAAVHAALAAAIYEVALPEHKDLPYGTLSIFDYRKHLAKSTDEWPMGAYIMGLPVKVSRGDFLANAKTVHAFYRQPISGPEFANRDTYVAYMGVMAQLMTMAPPEGTPLPTNPTYSSLGLIDPILEQRYGSVTIEDIDVCVDILLPTISLIQWTWKGVFNLGVNYNDAYFDAAFMEDFMKRVEKNLVAGLGL